MHNKYHRITIPDEIILGCILLVLIGSISFFFGKMHTALSIVQKPALAQEKKTLEIKGIVFHGDRNKKEIALTFDADMTAFMKQQVLSGKRGPSYSQQVIDVLTQTKTPATIFMTGLWIEMYPGITKELAENPLFELANHSYAHIAYSGYCYGLGDLPASKKDEDIQKTNQLLSLYTQKNHFFFRFPGGCFSSEDVKIVKNAGDIPVQWDSEGNDGFTNDTNRIIQNVLTTVKNGSIIVLHFNGAPTAPKTAEALPKIITALKQQGYTFVTLSTLLQ